MSPHCRDAHGTGKRGEEGEGGGGGLRRRGGTPSVPEPRRGDDGGTLLELSGSPLGSPVGVTWEYAKGPLCANIST